MATAGSLLQGMQGKLGTMVLRNKVGGGTVAANLPRKTNSNTEAQQKVRSSFKLISQLASQIADIIAIPRDGAKSSRNLFSQINSQLVYANNIGAFIDLEEVQLTKSNNQFVNLSIGREAGEFSVYSLENTKQICDKIVILILKANDSGSLSLLNSEIIDSGVEIERNYNNADGKYDGNIVVYAYGIKFETEAARVKYANMNISTADEVAQVVVNRSFSTSEASVTKTSGAEIAANETEGGYDSVKYRVKIYKWGLKGTVTGGGYYSPGESVTIKFTPTNSTQHFEKWKFVFGGREITQNPYTFTMPSHNEKIGVVGYITQS